MAQPEYWNHNAAYYPWVERHLRGRRRILDVGCGNGALAAVLEAPERRILGIDPFPACIEAAKKRELGEDISFENCTLEELEAPAGSLDAVVFAASLHHMDPERALGKAVSLLKPGGVLLAVGLAKPSSPGDHVLEALRVLPSALLTRLHRERSSEELGVPVSYDLPPMGEVRRLARTLLPGARLRQALHYRYLLRWVKPEE